jgi:DegV family protein with EDD domain
MISIVTDSCADLSPELVQRYGIQVVPFAVTVGDRSFRDGVDLDAWGIYCLVEETGQLPKTAAPPIPDYIAAFDRPGEIIFTGIGSRLSAGFQNAHLAAEQFPPGKVRVIDSANLSTGVGLLALRAADLREQGCSADEIEAQLQAAVPKVHTSFVVETLRYLYMGGRCTAVESFVGSLLKIRPVLELRDGIVDVKEKIRGTRKRALQSMLDDFAAHLSEIDLRRVFVTHSGSGDADYLASEVRRIGAPQEVLITQAGCTVSSHCGPDTIGILYLTR